MTSEIVVLRVFGSEFEALLAQDDLEADDIPSSVLTDSWSEVAVRREFRLSVRGPDVERALACLAEANRARRLAANEDRIG